VTPRVALFSSLALLFLAIACTRDESAGIIAAAHAADDAWTCPADSTRTFELSAGRYRLAGCERVAVYLCTGRPPACARQK
jgi:hypothetical protein